MPSCTPGYRWGRLLKCFIVGLLHCLSLSINVRGCCVNMAWWERRRVVTRTKSKIYKTADVNLTCVGHSDMRCPASQVCGTTVRKNRGRDWSICSLCFVCSRDFD